MAMETYKGRTFDPSTGREWTAADSAAVRKWVAECEALTPEQWAAIRAEAEFPVCPNCYAEWLPNAVSAGLHQLVCPRCDAPFEEKYG